MSRKVLLGLFLIAPICFVGAQTMFSENIDTLLKQAKQFTNTGDYVNATKILYHAENICLKKKNANQLCTVYIGLSKVYMRSENKTSLQETIKKAETSCLRCNDLNSLGKLNLVKGVLYSMLSLPDSSILFFKKSSEYYLLNKDTIQSANALGKVGNILEINKQYAEALPYYQRFYDVAIKQSDINFILTANIYLSGSYIYLNQPQKAKIYNAQAKKIALELKNNYEYAVTMQYDALIYEKQHLYSKAFEAMKRYSDYYRDTLISSERVGQIEELKLKYETASKEALLAQQSQRITKQNAWIWTSLIVVFIFLLGSALMYRLIQKLKKSNLQKEFLIKEIHHRVKNNLQVLSSLLHLQSNYLTDTNAMDAIREGENRVTAMGLIHQKLYTNDNMTSIEISDFIVNLVDQLLYSFGVEKNLVKVEYKLSKLQLDIDTAIPLGLILNELVTNSLKYAFLGNNQGVLSISLWIDEINRLCLEVSDTGQQNPSLIQQEQATKSTQFGKSLIFMLSKKLKGKIEILNSKGYSTLIKFEKYKLVNP